MELAEYGLLGALLGALLLGLHRLISATAKWALPKVDDLIEVFKESVVTNTETNRINSDAIVQNSEAIVTIATMLESHGQVLERQGEALDGIQKAVEQISKGHPIHRRERNPTDPEPS